MIYHLRMFFLLSFALLTACQAATPVCLVNDQQAFDYCKKNKHTYVAVVWPRGMHDLTYIGDTLNSHAQVKYTKTLQFSKRDLFRVYRALHKRLSYKSARKYFAPYIKEMEQPFTLVALLLETNEPLEVIQEWKAEIRNNIGLGYQSFHINDAYKETIEAAQLLFLNNGVRS